MRKSLFLAVLVAAQSGCLNTDRRVNEGIAAAEREQVAAEARKRDAAARLQAELLAESRAKLAKAEQLEQTGIAAEKAGRPREALKQYLAALESLPEKASADVELRLRKRVIEQAQRLNPPPAIAEEAERQMVFGATALKSAKTAADYGRAVAAFEKAARLAPWWAPAYFNLALVQERARNYEAAARNFQLYLVAAPDASDAKEVRTKIYELEYRQQTAPAERLNGFWTDRDAKDKRRYRIEAEGKSVKIYAVQKDKNDQLRFEGSLAGSVISGTYAFDERKQAHPDCNDYSGAVIVTCSFGGGYKFSAELAGDGNMLDARYEEPVISFDSSVPLVGKPRISFREKSRASRSLTLVRE